MKKYISPATQQTNVVLLNALLGASGGGSTQMNVVDDNKTQQSGAMSPARILYI